MSNRDGKREIYVIEADGSNLQRLTHDDRAAARPAWSPDGKKLAFMSTRHASERKADDDDEWDIYVMDADAAKENTILSLLEEVRSSLSVTDPE